MDTIKLIGGYDMCVPFFLNGLILNSKIFLPRTHDIQSTIGGDFELFVDGSDHILHQKDDLVRV